MQLKNINNSHLVDFLEYSKNLVDLYSIPRDNLSKEWIDIKVNIADSIISLYSFSNSLYEIKIFDNNKDDIRFYSFYFDLILSKLRHSLFTETPKDSFEDIYPSTAKEIAAIGQELYNSKILDDDFNINFQRFIFKIFLMYDFIFYENEGCFTSFKLDRDLFIKIKDTALAPIKGSDTTDFGQDIVINILNKTLDITTNTYKQYVSKAKSSTVYIEPLSYFLGFKIWKISKIIHATLEFKNKNDLTNHKKDFKEEFKKYLNEYKQTILEFYDNNITNAEMLYKVYKLDKVILSEVLQKGLLFPYRDDVILKKERLNIKKKDIDNNKINLSKLLNDMISNAKDDYDRFKFYRVLEDKDITIDEIAYIIELMGSNIKQDGDFELVGMLRSGVLLAHCINVSQKLFKPVIMFSSFPYISFLPRINSSSINILFIDESIKSRFSTRLANLYKQRILRTNGINIFNYKSKVLSVVDFKDFNKKKVSISSNSIARVNIINNNVTLDENSMQEDKINSVFDWKSYIEDLNANDLESPELQDEHTRLDITKLLSNSNSLFYISKVFAQKLNDLEDEEIILYSSTDEGKLLVDSTIFAYKALYPDKKKKFYLNKKKSKIAYKTNCTKLIIVDMTIDSMATLKRTLKYDFDLKMDKEDFYFTIFASPEAQEKLGAKLYKIKDLRNN
jgi:hypothetical protein